MSVMYAKRAHISNWALLQDGRTALHLACRGRNLKIVCALIAAGSNLDSRSVVCLLLPLLRYVLILDDHSE